MVDKWPAVLNLLVIAPLSLSREKKIEMRLKLNSFELQGHLISATKRQPSTMTLDPAQRYKILAVKSTKVKT